MKNTIKNTSNFRYVGINVYTNKSVITYSDIINIVKINGDSVRLRLIYINNRL